MKVKLFNKLLWKDFFMFLSVISVVSSLLFLFFEIPPENKLCFFIIFSFCLIVIFLIRWYRANRLNKIALKINNSIVKIEVGDIFKEEGFKIIAFNDFFDTQVDDTIIAKTTLNSKYITRFYPQISDLDAIISSDTHSVDYILCEKKRKIGKTKQYKLGTIIKNDEYFLLAFTHFDQDNRAFLNIEDYIVCLMNMWNECDILYGGNSVVLPLLGSGITRLKGCENITDQELLEIIIWTFKTRPIKFQYPSYVKIVLSNESMSEINLYEIKKKFTL